MLKPFLTLATTAAIVLMSATAVAATGGKGGDLGPKMLGKGRPFVREDLPPGLRGRYDALSEQRKRNAEQWLQGFSFPEKDADTLYFDRDGGVFYIDPIAPEQTIEDAAAGAAAAEASLGAAADAFQLHSRLGSPNLVYLDFDGHTFSNTAWSSGTLYAKPFDTDGSPSTFSDAEKQAIAEIWHRVAEDYAGFDVDVTTEQPASFGPRTGRVLITSKTDALGQAMPYNTGGGVAYINVWGASNYASYYSPALVYFDNLASGTTYTAEACSHELGHNLGLSHDGTSSATYYAGHGSGYTSWAPVMGNSYYMNVTQLSKGEYAGANNTQDDIAIVAAKLGVVGDDHGNAPSAATWLAVESSGDILVSNPETDPHNAYPENKGVIEAMGDVDVFKFKAEAGPLNLMVVPAWDAFYRTDKRGANLDIRAVLRDGSGVVLVSSDPTSDTYASISSTIPAGTYYLEVSSVGNGNYSSYASVGQYFVSGSIVPATAANTPPSASFDAACAGKDCSFSDRSVDADGTIVAQSWNFGDGAISAERNPTHAYAKTGTYTVVLTVTDDAGAKASANRQVSVVVPNVAPTASFTRSCSGLACTFTDRSSDLDGTLVSWLWNFGDGSSSTVRNPAHTYAAYGTYTVTLTVSDNQGAQATVTGSVTLKARGKRK